MSPERALLTERQLKNLIGKPTTAVINEIVRRNPEIESVAVSRFLYKDPLLPRRISRETILGGGMEGYVQQMREERMSLSSKVSDGRVLMSKVSLRGFWLWGRDGFIPMIDFEGRPPFQEADRSFLRGDGKLPVWPSWILFRLRRALRDIGQEEGVFIDSGGGRNLPSSSLHFLGLRIMDKEEFERFVEDLSCFPEIKVGPGENDVLRPDPVWVRNCGKPNIMNLRFTETILKAPPVVIATL